MFKQLVFFFCLALLVFGGYHLYLRLAPAASLIEWTIESAAEAFNTGNKVECLAAFADDYKDSSQGDAFDERTIDKKLLEQGLDYMFNNRIDPETGDLLYRVKPVMQTLTIKLQSETDATAQFRMVLRVKMGHTWSDVWGVEVNAKLRKQARDWVISSSSLRNLMGRRPWSWD